MHRIREYNSDSGTIVAKQYTIQFSAFGEPGTAKNQVGDELPVNRPKRPIISARCIVWTTAVCTWSLTQPGMPFGILVSHFTAGQLGASELRDCRMSPYLPIERNTGNEGDLASSAAPVK